MRSAWSRNPTPVALPRLLLAAVTALALLAGAATLAPASDAASATTNRIYKDWQADAEIDACSWTAIQLRTARREVQGDIQAYAPDFLDAIDDALGARAACRPERKASGGSGGGGAPGAGGGSGGGGSAAPSGADPAASGEDASPDTGAGASAAPAPTSTAGATTARSTPTPGPVLVPAGKPDDAVLAAARTPAGEDGGAAWVWALVGGAAALLLLVAWLVRWSGWVPRWAAPATHAIEEAGWRIGNRWSEFGDWMRRGR